MQIIIISRLAIFASLGSLMCNTLAPLRASNNVIHVSHYPLRCLQLALHGADNDTDTDTDSPDTSRYILTSDTRDFLARILARMSLLVSVSCRRRGISAEPPLRKTHGAIHKGGPRSRAVRFSAMRFSANR